MSTNLPIDPETLTQAAKYKELLQEIHEAKKRGEDYVLRGAKQIALWRWKDERRAKRIFAAKERYPYARQGAGFCLSVETAERWERYLEFCGIRDLNPIREAEKYGFGPPPQRKTLHPAGDGSPSPEPQPPSSRER